MKKLIFFVLFLSALFFNLIPNSLYASSEAERPFEGIFYNKENNVTVTLNLYDTVLVTPGYEFLGKVPGFIIGDIHETWFATSYEIREGKALIHFSNEMGSDDQDVLFTPQDSMHLDYEIQGKNCIRKVQNRKWACLPAKMIFERRKVPVAPPKKEDHFRQY